MTTAVVDHQSWGRAWQSTWFTALSTLFLISTTPLMVFYFFISFAYFDCSLVAPLWQAWKGELTAPQLWQMLPPISFQAFLLYGVWFSLQVVLAVRVPDRLGRFVPGYFGGRHEGAVTPAGNKLVYEINGLQAWLITHVLFVVFSFGLGVFSPTIIFDHWGELLWVVNICGNLLAVFAYVKAHRFPTHAEDCKSSGNPLYDFFMGVEFNPRIGPLDFKLFFNGRPGIVAWTLINISFAAAQFQIHGTVTNSMLLINLLHGIYVLDFFWHERWYLKTIDICHDHFGWMLAWGDLVWLPYMYTLQGLFLVIHPVNLSIPAFVGISILGFGAYALFRSVNSQKDNFRRTDGEGLIWGKRPEYIACEYVAGDGKKRESKLLVSGWWGMARHLNYTADLFGCLAYSLCCGTTHLFPYFYLIYMTILLVHRCRRDELRLTHKYGKSWDTYCKRVPYRLIPGIY